MNLNDTSVISKHCFTDNNTAVHINYQIGSHYKDTFIKHEATLENSFLPSAQHCGASVTVIQAGIHCDSDCLKIGSLMSKGQTGQEETAFSSVKPCVIGEDTCSSDDFHLTTLSLHVSSHAKNREGASKQATSLLLP